MKRIRVLQSAGLLLVLSSFALLSNPARSGAQTLPTPTSTSTKRAALPTNTPRADVVDPNAVPTLVVPNPASATMTPTAPPTLTATPTTIPTELLTETPTITPTTIGPVSYPENINTLTGLPFPNDEAKNRRNLIVKVSNFPWIVRPQAGLSYADIVWEYEVEGGVTRFAAIYRSQAPDFVGSIRSARLPDLELVVMYNALLAYSGANDSITKTINAAPWTYRAMTPQRGDNCPPFCRFPRLGVPFEHTLFGNTQEMWAVATRRNVNEGYPARGFAFAQTPDQGGKTASDIAIKWFGDQSVRWEYDPTDGKYHRWNTGLPHMDIATGKQLTADNVVIIQATHEERPDVYESESGSPAIEVQIWGREKAWVFRDGQWYEGWWIRRSRTRESVALSLVLEDGKTPIHLKPGQTWVEVVRCCKMFGVTVDGPAPDLTATAVNAAAIATARGPKIPTDPAEATAKVNEIIATRAVSAATQRVTTTPIYPTALPSLTPTP